MAETVTIKAYVTAAPDESAFATAETRREWEPMPTIKAYVTPAPDENAFAVAATKREWEPMPTIKAYVTAQPDENAFVTGETIRAVGASIQELSDRYQFERLQGVAVTYALEGLQTSVDIDNNYPIEITVAAPPQPEPGPNVQEPVLVTGRYGIELNPYFTPGSVGRTLYLNDKWDIFSDAAGNIALVNGAYAVAQNAANAVRLFKNDAYLNKSRGIPHFDIELGKAPSIAAPILRTRIKETVTGVNGITAAEVNLNFDAAGRVMGGEVQATILDSQNVQIDI